LRLTSAFFGVVLVACATPLFAQVTNPNVVEFRPPSGTTVNRYDVMFYAVRSTDAYLVLDIGVPARQADGMIRVDLTSRAGAFPRPGVESEIRVVAVGAGGAGVSSPSNAFVFAAASGGGADAYLGGIAWTAMANGWGPAERNRSNGENADGDGAAITLNGKGYAKGLGVHAPSAIRYPLGGACQTFKAEVGVDDEVGANGSITFEVWADGATLYDSGLMTGQTATKTVSVSVANRSELTLIVTDGGNGITSDHGDWANARVACTAPTAAAVP
jgi:hypothetical protein